MKRKDEIHADVSRDSLVAEAADEYEHLLEEGQRPDLEEFVGKYPQVADVLRRVLPALRVMDQYDADAPGRELGDFRIHDELGRGGMGVVYEAEQISLQRRVALKVLPFAAVMDPRQLQRFKNEAQAAAHLHHTHIVPVYSIGCERGVHYYAMQYIEGPTLAEIIEQLRSTPGKEVCGSSAAALEAITKSKSTQSEQYCRSVARLGIQAAEALDHAHQQGVIHRDIKPANLIVDAGGHLWITDFGLASLVNSPGLTTTGDIVGTVRYMSPEQALAKRVPVDHRTDTYSLGVTLYEFLTLEIAFKGDDLHEVIQDIATKDPRSAHSLNPAVPHELETILMKAMAKSPEERYETAQELADDLQRFLQNMPIEAKRPGWLKRAGKWAQRHGALVIGLAAILLLSTVGLATATALIWRERERSDAAQRRAEASARLALDALDRIYINRAEGLPVVREDLSRVLLEEGLRFYVALARENQADSEVSRRTGRAQLRASQILTELGQTAQAAETLAKGIATIRAVILRAPDDAVAHTYLGSALWLQGQLDDAIAAYREAIRLQPDSASARTSLGAALILAGRFEDAIFSFREAIRLRPDLAEAHTKLGAALVGSGRLEDAIAACREAIRLEPDYAEAHADLGAVLGRSGRLEEAIAALREAIRWRPDYARAHRNLGTALTASGRFEEALVAFREATRLRPYDAGSHSRLGQALHRGGRPEDAIAAFGEAIRLEADHLGSLNALAWLRATTTDPRLRDPNEAVTLAKRAVKRVPQAGPIWNTLGVAHYRAGNWQEAVSALEKSMALRSGGDACDWFFLAMAHRQLEQRDKARDWFDKAVAWMDENERDDPELGRFREEAAGLLGVKEED